MDFAQGQMCPRRRRSDKVRHQLWRLYRALSAVAIILLLVVSVIVH